MFNDGLAQVDESFSVVHRFDLPPDMAGRYAIMFLDFIGTKLDLFGFPQEVRDCADTIRPILPLSVLKVIHKILTH